MMSRWLFIGCGRIHCCSFCGRPIPESRLEILGGGQDRYVCYERAGDQYAGRLLCGVNVDSAEFAMLPPSFQDVSEALVVEMITECVGSISDSQRKVVEMRWASVV